MVAKDPLEGVWRVDDGDVVVKLDDLSRESLRLWVATQLMAAQWEHTEGFPPHDDYIRDCLDLAERMIDQNRSYRP